MTGWLVFNTPEGSLWVDPVKETAIHDGGDWCKRVAGANWALPMWFDRHDWEMRYEQPPNPSN